MTRLTTTRRPDLPALTGLRFVAALAVVAFHLRGHFSALLPASAPLDPALSVGALGVELFFVLSGFILAYHYLDALARPSLRGYARFVRNRVARIFPLHIAALLLFALFVGGMAAAGRPVSNAADYPLGDLVANLTLTQCWTLRDCGANWNAPAWSLSAEWLAYLTFPLVALFVRRPRGRAGVLTAIAATIAAQLLLTEVAGFDGGIGRVAATFTLGALLARLHVDGLPALNWAPVAVWAGASATISAMALATAGGSAGLAVPLFGLLVLALANAPEGRLGRWLARPGMRFWGEASYGLYLTHALVLAVAAEFVRLELVAAAPLAVRAGLPASYVLAMLVVAAVAHRQVERPCRELLRTRGDGTPAGPTPTAVAPVVATTGQHMAQSAPIP